MQTLSAGSMMSKKPRPLAPSTIPWPEVDTWSLDTVPIEFNAAGTDMVGCVWNNDGTKIYAWGDTGGTSGIYHNDPDYTVPYVPTDDTSPPSAGLDLSTGRGREHAWNGDGTALIVARFGDSTIKKYTHTGTAYNPVDGDINSTPTESFTFAPGGVRSIDISPDGLTMWAVSNTIGRDIYEVTMSSAFDLTTASMGSEYEPSEGDMFCMKFSPDGFKYYALALSGILYEYSVSSQWDISTSSYVSRSLNVLNSRSPICFDVSPDGTKMIVGFFDIDSADTEFAYYTA